MMPLTVPIPVGQLMMQAQQKAAVSREQLLEDVAALDRYNRDVNGVNDRATEALSGRLARDARAEAKGLDQVVVRLDRDLHESVPAATRAGEEGQAPAPKAVVQTSHAARASGRERRCGRSSGLQPVEALRTGDLVLAQDSDTGGWSYKPVLAIRHGMRQPIKKLTIGDKLDRSHRSRTLLGGRQGLGDGG